MAALMVTSVGEAAGKSALCVGLGKIFQREGISAGYYKPRFSLDPSSREPDLDAAFIRKVLSLDEPPELISPVVGIMPLEAGEEEEVLLKLRDGYERASQGKGITLVEMPGSLDGEGGPIIVRAAETLDAKVLVVVRYRQGIEGGPIAQRVSPLGERLAGVVVNAVPARVMPVVKPSLESSFSPPKAEGIKLLGLLPEERALFGFSVGELAEHLGGEFLCRSERSGDLVENLMIGANPPDPDLGYFSSKPNKAVFCRSDRPDIQLAALDTETRCLVLTGAGQYQTSLIYRAEDLGVPVVRVATDTMTTVANLNGLIQKVRFHQDGKVEKIQEILEAGLDFQALRAALGIS